MNDADQKRYADLVEICARVFAFYELTETAIPAVTVELQVEASELAGGWADFDPDRPRAEQHLPIVDAVSDQIFERANELRRGLFGMRREPPPLRH
jgi:hypothetical protein